MNDACLLAFCRWLAGDRGATFFHRAGCGCPSELKELAPWAEQVRTEHGHGPNDEMRDLGQGEK